MRAAITWSLATGCLAAAAALSTHAAGTVDVRFVQPETFADAGLPGFNRERTLRRLADEFQQLAQKLPDGQSMTVEVLDVDLAGDLDPTRGNIDQRVLRGKSDWPRIHLRYTLAAGGKPLKSGEEWIADLLYLDRRARLLDTRDLAYERRMLEDWFDERVLGAAATK
jgi:Protein of unknown function (DUF3016)